MRFGSILSVGLAIVQVTNALVINQYHGEAAGDNNGRSVSRAGDVNGDGYQDFVFGAFNKKSVDGKNQTGKAYLVYGSPTVGVDTVDLSSLPSLQGFPIIGPHVNSSCGYSASAAGDVNADGLEDFVVGCFGAGSADTTAFVGAAYVIFGKSGPAAALNLAAFNRSHGFVITGAKTKDNAGFSVSGAGDVNNDGYADVVVGAYGADPFGRTNAGTTYIMFGGPTESLTDVSLADWESNCPRLGTHAVQARGFAIWGAHSNDFSGLSVSNAGDVDNDGYADVLVGAFGASPTTPTSMAGKSYLLFGAATAACTNVDLNDLSPSQGIVMNGGFPGDFSGISVSDAGDVDGDGFADWLVGAHHGDLLGRVNAGVTYVLFGGSRESLVDFELGSLTTDRGVAIVGKAAADFSGISVSFAGDVNGDGLGDILTGSFHALGGKGEAYLLYGRSRANWVATGGVLDLAALTAADGRVLLSGQQVGDAVGVAVSGAGDVNGDGLADMLVGANFQNAVSDRYQSGESYLVLGSVTME